MGVIEVVLAGLCFNTTCPGDIDQLTLKAQRLRNLAADLKDETLLITTFKNGYLSGTEELNGTLTGTGVSFDLINILQDKYGFQYTIVNPEDNVFGTGQNGIYNLLATNKVNIAAAFLPVINEYRKKIHYSPSLDSGDWVVLMRRPKESATGSGLLAPFTAPVWLLIILSLLVVGPIIYLLIFLQSRLCRDDHNTVFPLPSCIWFVYGALLKQGTTLNPVTDSSRLLFSTWWIFITILTAFYTANLTAFLTLSKFTLPISKPEDIGKKHYKWISNKGNAIEDVLIEESKNLEIENQMKLRSAIGSAYSYPDLIDETILYNFVDKREMMYIRERPIVDYVMYKDYKQKAKNNISEEDRCVFVITKWSVTTLPRAFAYSHDFKYTELFDITIQYLVESGIIRFKLKEQLPDTEICPLNLGNTERQLRNSDLIMTYEIVGGGLLVSAVVFLIELLIFRHKLRKATQNNNRPVTKNLNIFNPFTLGSPKGKEKPIKKYVTPPPSYNTLFNPLFAKHNKNWKKKMINGREYFVINSGSGYSELIPVRTPSALLFQYSN